MRVALAVTLALAAFAVCVPSARAASDEDALNVADRAAAGPAPDRRDWQVFGEAAASAVDQRQGLPSYTGLRASIDFRLDTKLAPAWRLILADRLDANRLSRDATGGTFGSATAGEDTINTLKEAYVGWQPAGNRWLDLGRINTRQGVGTGFNPTDYFKVNAVRSQVSFDPASLRENRLGTVMLRGQSLWQGGSIGALIAPKLADAPSGASYSLDLGATNRSTRWLLYGTQRLAADFSPQWLIAGESGKPVQFGLNLTRLLGDASVGFLEWSGGRGNSLLALAGDRAEERAFRSRLSTGVTYTTARKLSITVEYDYNGAALDRDGWRQLRELPAGATLQYLGYASAAQDLSVRHGLFLYGTWQDAGMPRLDLTAMLRLDLVGQSRMSWLEARYRWDRTEAALQWLRNDGDPVSAFGALPTRTWMQVVARHHF